MTTSPADPTGPGPRRVVSVDLDVELPVLVADERYSTAMVVGYRGGVPLGAVDFRLTADPADARVAMAPLLEIEVPAESGADIADADLPSISVVVSTIVGREDDLALLLETFDRLTYPGPVEFLLVDNRVTRPAIDALPGLTAGHDDVRIIRESRPGISAGRNAGVEAARHEVVAFTDDDVRVDDNWLRVIGRRFAEVDSIDAMTGLILPAELETPAQIWFEGYYGGFAGERQFVPLVIEAAADLPRAVRGSKITVSDSAGVEQKRIALYGIGAYGAGANMAFRRSALTRVRGFDTALGTGTPSLGGEDLATLASILWTGGRLAFEPRAVVHHRHRRGVDELHRQLHGYGLGFTAMLTSLILRDPRHLLALGRQVPLATRRFTNQALDRVLHRSAGARTPVPADEGLSTGYPRSLVTTELRGFPQGPLAYLTSRRARLVIERTHVVSDDSAPVPSTLTGGRR